jgi:hypothetical protein
MVRFSLNSSVDLTNPRLSKFIGLVLDQVSIMNDLASWEKEKKAYDTGKMFYLINTVEVARQLLGLPTYKAAVEIVQGLLFQVECQIDEEIQHLIDSGVLTEEEWIFVDASLYMVSGNAFTSVVMARYGDEGCRLE